MLTDLIRRIGEYSAVDRAICDNGEGQVMARNYSRVAADLCRAMFALARILSALTPRADFRGGIAEGLRLTQAV